ncbi:hypothetical protein B0T24DRAFT_200500 [Lasiosphaeria ovina]|uniref:MACPF domain-containing protein n=1 Tax=Lasiosphaeria ovina TaxID=92902 RepID=A0AAE0NFW9_9PEZI|nr:hypothetical protein B0T24DRAFT_200500 [Lasiosphaeria ovina]
MGLVDDFPHDPLMPSLRYAATCQIPVNLPWAREPVLLGTSLSVSRQQGVKSEFLDKSRSAFSQQSLDESPLVFTSASGGKVTMAESMGAASAYEHTDFSLSGSIGGSFLGAEGEAKYEKTVASDSSQSQCSFRTNYRSGMVGFMHEPRLSAEAVALLRCAKDAAAAQAAFRAAYGEYYVAAYVLGGTNSTMLGGSTATSSYSKDLRGSFTIKILWVRIRKSFEEHERSASAFGAGTLAVYDSLDDCQLNSGAADVASVTRLVVSAAENSDRGWDLARRVGDRAGRMGMGLDALGRMSISRDQCAALCRAGLVVELLLLPYAGLRHYVEAFHNA